MLVLLPPSREKSAEAHRVPWHRGALGQGPLAEHRREVVDAALAAVHASRRDTAALGRLLDAAGGALGPATEALEAIDEDPTAAYLGRYTGILYRVLRDEAWTDALARRAQRQIAVSSALWGLVTGRDAIPRARLNIAASLAALDGSLATWWRDRLAPVIDPIARQRVVVDLRSSGYDRTWVAPEEARGVITVRFLPAHGQRAEPSAFGKQRKGALARALLEAGLEDDAPLARIVEAAAGPVAGTRLSRRESVVGTHDAHLVFRATG